MHRNIFNTRPFNSAFVAPDETSELHAPANQTTKTQFAKLRQDGSHEQDRMDILRNRDASARARILKPGLSSVAAASEASAIPRPLRPISMKSQEDASELGVPGGGVSRVNLMIAQRMAKKKGHSSEINNHLLAERSSDGKYYTSIPGEKNYQFAHGKYIFVRMLNGELRLGSATQGGNNAHSTLSGHSLGIAYAGEIEFENGEIQSFSNQSGTYLPPADLKHQSGFDGDEDKFRDVQAGKVPAA